MTVNAFKSGVFPIKETIGEILKILTPKQMFQRLSTVLAQVLAGNATKKLLNGIKQIINPLYQAKEYTKKAYNNIINSIKV